MHSIVEMTQFTCKDSNPKTILVEFDTGSLNKKDIWRICNSCNQKPEFLKFRIFEKEI
jgi:hypothetical protein